MIDLYCHILPGVDGWASTLTESGEMARVVAADGIKKIVATQHTCNGMHRNIRAEIIRGGEELNDAFDRCAIPVDVIPGADAKLTYREDKRKQPGKSLFQRLFNQDEGIKAVLNIVNLSGK